MSLADSGDVNRRRGSALMLALLATVTVTAMGYLANVVGMAALARSATRRSTVRSAALADGCFANIASWAGAVMTSAPSPSTRDSLWGNLTVPVGVYDARCRLALRARGSRLDINRHSSEAIAAALSDLQIANAASVVARIRSYQARRRGAIQTDAELSSVLGRETYARVWRLLGTNEGAALLSALPARLSESTRAMLRDTTPMPTGWILEVRIRSTDIAFGTDDSIETRAIARLIRDGTGVTVVDRHFGLAARAERSS